MFSSLGRPALVPILMPGGIGRMVAELEAADASNAAPPIASLANSRLVSGFCDSGLVILLKLRANGYLNVGLCPIRLFRDRIAGSIYHRTLEGRVAGGAGLNRRAAVP